MPKQIKNSAWLKNKRIKRFIGVLLLPLVLNALIIGAIYYITGPVEQLASNCPSDWRVEAGAGHMVKPMALDIPGR